ncbi:hypothetical protein ABIA33_006855 [Streptacidiphilus sp. MAP12-16]|jgi:hypothetical protein|uniref:DUF397 domain-containing protein n=1 Tax=Streptacidiphilus sp. MAP12-16 TaxID=3156300 RepID=UPI003511B2F1
MTIHPSFEFVRTAHCRDRKVNNCPEVATNVPGVVALRDSERPATVVTMSPESWRTLVAAAKAGEFDQTA